MNDKTKSRIQNFFGKLTGANRMQEEIDTLYYFLNNYADVCKAGPTKDAQLRDLQILNTELLAIFDAACSRHGLTYWLDYGSALGCVRHGGFIPWDDDVDVAMPREDYDRVIPLMKDEMDKFGIIIRSGGYFDDRGPMERLAVAYKTLETGGWIDIFPVDHVCADGQVAPGNVSSHSASANQVSADGQAAQLRAQISDLCDEYCLLYRKHHRNWSEAQFIEAKNRIFGRIPSGEHIIYFHGQEFEGCNDFIMNEEDIFPLERLRFENYEFNMPQKYDTFLREQYGDSYMSFPKKGVEHHLDPDGNTAKTRASRSGTDMAAEIEYLRGVLREYRKAN